MIYFLTTMCYFSTLEGYLNVSITTPISIKMSLLSQHAALKRGLVKPSSGSKTGGGLLLFFSLGCLLNTHWVQEHM